jgi:hypothetical protein
LGYTGSANLLVRYLNQGRAEGDRPVTTPRHAGRLLLTDPKSLRPKETTLLEKIAAACPEMTALADLVGGFAALLKPAEGNDAKLTKWITAARAVDLPHLRSFTNGLEIDRPAVNAGRVICIGREALRCLLARRGVTFQRTKTWKESPDPEREAKLDRIGHALDRFPDRVFAFDEFGPLGIRPTAGSGWAEQRRPGRLPATYHRTHGVRYFHGCYSVGDDRLWA